MIYLTTGANGAGKTLFTLRDVRAMQVKEGRPVVYNGRFDMVADFGWKKAEFKDWQDEPDGTIFFVDECHNDMPVRAGNSAGNVPDHIKMLAEHRKRGFDFFLLTQHPLNIDTFVRRLIGPPGWHRHIKRMLGASSMASILTWTAVNERCEKEGVGASAAITTAGFPKEVYEWYRSAELHTGKRRIPKQFYVIALCAIAVPALGYAAWSMLMGKFGAKPQMASVSAPGATQAMGSAPASQKAAPRTASEYVAAYRPRFTGLMHTAPAYDQLTEPKRVPVPAACVSMPSKGCKCFTQDATPYPIDEAMCQGLVRHGTFYAFKAEGEATPLVQRQTAAERPMSTVVDDRGAGLTLIGAPPSAGPVAPEPAPPLPQRIASVRR